VLQDRCVHVAAEGDTLIVVPSSLHLSALASPSHLILATGYFENLDDLRSNWQ
jgi:hypothetical protein